MKMHRALVNVSNNKRAVTKLVFSLIHDKIKIQKNWVGSLKCACAPFLERTAMTDGTHRKL